jgi:hypothetical protein
LSGSAPLLFEIDKARAFEAQTTKDENSGSRRVPILRLDNQKKC